MFEEVLGRLEQAEAAGHSFHKYRARLAFFIGINYARLLGPDPVDEDRAVRGCSDYHKLCSICPAVHDKPSKATDVCPDCGFIACTNFECPSCLNAEQGRKPASWRQARARKLLTALAQIQGRPADIGEAILGGLAGADTIGAVRRGLKKMRRPDLYCYAPYIVNRAFELHNDRLTPDEEARTLSFANFLSAEWEQVERLPRTSMPPAYCLYKSLQHILPEGDKKIALLGSIWLGGPASLSRRELFCREIYAKHGIEWAPIFSSEVRKAKSRRACYRDKIEIRASS